VKTLKTWAAAAAIAVLGGAAHAALVSRVGGTMIYDTTRNITWLADMNYAASSGYAAANAGGFGSDGIQSNGRMGWNAASEWATNLIYGGYRDWRLPTMNPTDTTCTGGFGVGRGYHCTDGELSGLFVTDLGYDSNFGPITSGATAEQIANLAMFSDVQFGVYWSGTEDPRDPSKVWNFDNIYGFQDHTVKSPWSFAVAVRTGDVAVSVPEPQTLALALLALGATVVARKRRLA
jgi:hypothetical protein